MWVRFIGNLVAGSRSQFELPAVAQFSVKLAFQHEKDMAPASPMVCQVPRRILHHANADVTDLQSPPERLAGDTGVFCGCNRAPVHCAEGNIFNLHSNLLYVAPLLQGGQ